MMNSFQTKKCLLIPPDSLDAWGEGGTNSNRRRNSKSRCKGNYTMCTNSNKVLHDKLEVASLWMLARSLRVRLAHPVPWGSDFLVGSFK